MSHAPAQSLSNPTAADDNYASLASEIVDTFYKIYGTHPGFRVNHAKGIVVQGSFVGTPAAAALSRAALFDGSTIPVTVRFSDGGGLPTVPDADNPHGMAIKYHLPGGADTDMVISGSASRSILEIVVLPAPEGEESTISRPRRRRVGWSDEASMAVLASGEPWPSSGRVTHCTKITLEIVRRNAYCALQHIRG